ncbi:MAG: hypothetical protein ACI8ZN_002583 [Bacteroidia bacterium]
MTKPICIALAQNNFNLILFCLISQPLQAQDSCACCTPERQAFDFGLGDRVVFDTADNQIGENIIVKLEDGCIIDENWKGCAGGSGKSYNYYNATDSTWNQVWITNSCNNLVLTGRRAGNAMVLRSELLPGQRIPLYFNQLTWTNHADGTVIQNWEICNPEGVVVNTPFYGIYKRRKKNKV